MNAKSLSSWRAWIEIKTGEKQDDKKLGRSPHGERGLKFPRHERETLLTARRSPHGERGLKFVDDGQLEVFGIVALLMESVD